MIHENLFSPELECKISELIANVNNSKVNLFDYRRHNSKEKFDVDVVEAVRLADQRQKREK